MENKFSTYDFLGYLLPGSVVVLVLFYYSKIYYPTVVGVFGQDTLAATSFLVSSFIAGHFMQSISSGKVEDFFYWLSGGKPSYRLVTRGLKCMSHQRWLEAKAAILRGLGYAETDAQISAYSDEEAIRLAFQSSRKLGEAERFNGLYALNRALLASLLVASVAVGALTAQTWSASHNLWPLMISLGLFLIQLNRYRQRGEYLVVEVVRQAELKARGKVCGDRAVNDN